MNMKSPEVKHNVTEILLLLLPFHTDQLSRNLISPQPSPYLLGAKLGTNVSQTMWHMKH